MSYIFKAEYQDTKYKILSEYPKGEVYIGIRPDIVKIYSPYIYNAINSALNAGETVFIPKLCIGNIDYSDVIINDDSYDELDIEKIVARKRAQDIILSLRVNKSVFIYLYKMLLAKNICTNVTGMVITADNKEDVFLDIISKASEMEDESAGEVLIKTLEDYLDPYNKVSMIFDSILNELYKFDKQIDNIKVVQESDKELGENEYPTLEDAIAAVKSKYADFANVWGI